MKKAQPHKFQTLDEFYDRKGNSFDILRFILAALVILSHSYVLLQGASTSGDFLERFSRFQLSLGDFAVYSFFVISGFLITQSLLSSKSIMSYIRKRVLRIFPAFFVSLALIALIIGPIFTKYSIKEYFSLNEQGPFQFIFKNITFNFLGYCWNVADVFSKNPFPSSANGSMWTLKHEFALYMLLPVFSYFFVFRFKKMLKIITLFSILLSVLILLFDFRLFNFQSLKYWVLSANEYSNFVKLAPYFLLGCLIYCYKNKLIIHNRFIFLSLLLLVIGFKTNYAQIITLLTLPYLILSVAIKFNTFSFNKYGDFSYGMYIYAFPIQQLVVSLWGEHLDLKSFFIISFLFTLIISIMSWHFIEKQFLKYK